MTTNINLSHSQMSIAATTAARIYAQEQNEIRKMNEQIRNAELAEAAALKEAERQARIKAEAERIEAQLRAERALAEEQARLEKAAMDAMIETELNRLRNRSEVEILRDELTELKNQLAQMQSAKITLLSTTFKPVERRFLLTCPPQNGNECGWSCNFKDKNNNILFHFNPRPSGVIVLNTFTLNKGWGYEDRGCPKINCNANNQINITLSSRGFEVSQNGQIHLYPHRINADLTEIRLDPMASSTSVGCCYEVSN